jgi:ribosomal protein S18 acetylase RimI-like enzyme
MGQDPQNPFVVKQATAEDTDSILDLLSALQAEVEPGDRPRPDRVIEFLSGEGAGILLASAAGAAAGLLSYVRVATVFHAAPSLRVDALVVAPSYRRRGVARRLLEAAIGTGRRMGCAEIEVSTLDDNQPAQRLYQSLGFEGPAHLYELHLVQD